MSCNCRPYIYTANTSTQDVAANSTISLGRVIHQKCDKCVLNGDGIVCSGGRRSYFVTVNVTLSPTEAGDVTIQLMQDGVAVPGAIATQTAVANAQESLTINAIIRNDTCVSSVLTVQNSGLAASVSNCAVTVRVI